MAYLDGKTLVLEAVLTRRGRQLLAANDGSFRITQFGLSDDEVDYRLYNPAHPSGSAFYGEAIEKLPVFEAITDETQAIVSKLVTLPRGTSKLPVISLGLTTISLRQGATINITPQTLNYQSTTSIYESSGYTMTVSDVRLLSSFRGVGNDNSTSTATVVSGTSGAKLSKTEVGTSFTLVATTLDQLFTGGQTQLTTTISVVGRDSGARLSIPLIILKK